MNDDELTTADSGLQYDEPDRSNKEAFIVTLLFVGVVGMSMALVGLDLNVGVPEEAQEPSGEETSSEGLDPGDLFDTAALAKAAAILPGELVMAASQDLIKEILYEDESGELPQDLANAADSEEATAQAERAGSNNAESRSADPYDDLVMVGDAETPVRNAQGEQVKVATPKTRVPTSPRSQLPDAPSDKESQQRAANPAPPDEEQPTAKTAEAPSKPAASGSDLKGQMNDAKKKLRSGDPVGAAKAYKKALNMGGGAGARLGLAKAQYEMGNTKQAQRELKKVLGSNPRSGGALLLMGSISQGQGDRAGARSYYQKFLDAHPNSKRSDRIRSILTRL